MTTRQLHNLIKQSAVKDYNNNINTHEYTKQFNVTDKEYSYIKEQQSMKKLHTKKEKVTPDNIETFLEEVFNDFSSGKVTNSKLANYNITNMTNEELMQELERPYIYEELSKYIRYLVNGNGATSQLLQDNKIDINDVINEVLVILIHSIKTNDVNGRMIIYMTSKLIARNFKSSDFEDLSYNDSNIESMSSKRDYIQMYLKNEIAQEQDKVQRLDIVMHVMDIINTLGVDVVDYILNEYRDVKLLKHEQKQLKDLVNDQKATDKYLKRLKEIRLELLKQEEISDYLRGFGVLNRDLMNDNGYRNGLGHINKSTICYALDLIIKFK